jgi:selenocysteine lyase/cysteine desulfurase
MQPNRRQLLGAAVAGAPALLAAPSGASAQAKPAVLRANSIPAADLPKQFDVTPGIHNLEAGYWSLMPRVVAQEYDRHNAAINASNAIWARNVLPNDEGWYTDERRVQAALARQMGCAPGEVCVTRSGSDALQLLIASYNKIKPGEAVIHCDLDYDACIMAVESLKTSRGAQIVKFAMPEPATTANILGAYEAVLKATPNAKLMLVTQVSNRTGLVTPVKEIVALARAHGVDCVVDIAHGVACLDFQIEDLGCDFAGWSVHKWTSAPLGTGAMYIRKSRIADIDIGFGNRNRSADDIGMRLPAGTLNFPAVLTIPTAIDFHFAVGGAAKEKHMRALRDRWVNAVADLPNVTMSVPNDPARYCAITSFRLKGMDTGEKALRVQKTLFEKYKILTVWRTGVAAGPVIRVTPGLYSTDADVDALAKALRAEHAMFV